jgi:hypothetical protein
METALSAHKKFIEKERARKEAENNLKHLAGRLRILETEEHRVLLIITF